MRKTSNIDKLSSSLYEALMAHFLHQDRLVWDMAQLIIVIQSGILVSSFALREHWIASVILILGSILTIVILFLVIKIEIDRDVNQVIIEKLADYIIPLSVKKELRDVGFNRPYVRMSTLLTRRLLFIRGRYIIRGVFITFALIDILLAIAYKYFGYLFQI